MLYNKICSINLNIYIYKNYMIHIIELLFDYFIDII